MLLIGDSVQIKNRMAISEDSGETARNEPSHLDLLFVQVSVLIKVRIKIFAGVRPMTFIHLNLLYGKLVPSSHQPHHPLHLQRRK